MTLASVIKPIEVLTAYMVALPAKREFYDMNSDINSVVCSNSHEIFLTNSKE